MKFHAVDTETDLIAPLNIAPQLVCASLSAWDGTEEQEPLLLPHYGNELRAAWHALIEGGDQLVFHNAAFDLAVLYRAFPETVRSICKAIEAGRIHDTKIREQLILLQKFGHTDMLIGPGDVASKVMLSLAELASRYLGKTMEGKDGEEDSFRLNFAMMKDKPLSDYPPEFKAYALEDATTTARLFLAQQEGEPLPTESLQVGVDFALFCMTAYGVAVDQEEADKLEKQVQEELSEENLKPLIDSGILRPAVPPRPYKKGAKNKDGTPKMTKAKPASRDMKKLRKHVEQVCNTHQIEILFTKDNDPKEGEPSTSEPFIRDLAPLDPILAAYARYMKQQKIVSTEIPRIRNAADTGIIHPGFNVLVNTGRTSSKDAGKGSKKTRLFPSANLQNIDRRCRRMYKAREGSIWGSTDFNALELCSWASQCRKVLGWSRLGDLIDAGIDPHAYLGAQLAAHTDHHFKEWAEQGFPADPNDPFKQAYDAFMFCKDSEREENRKFFKRFRTFAKPVDLGVPGGMGAKTIAQVAHDTYYVDMSLEQAEQFYEIMERVFPETTPYFDWVRDNLRQPSGTNKFWYTSPMGMVRSNCSWTAACNGFGLQTPSAEGNKVAIWNFFRACYDPSFGSPIYGRVRPLIFVHDEMDYEIWDEENYQECVDEVERIMVEAMKSVLTNITITVETTLSRKWEKDLPSKRDEAGRIIIVENAA